MNLDRFVVRTSASPRLVIPTDFPLVETFIFLLSLQRCEMILIWSVVAIEAAGARSKSMMNFGYRFSDTTHLLNAHSI